MSINPGIGSRVKLIIRLIVTSGAIASGMSNLALRRRPTNVPLMQACAAVGQSALIAHLRAAFFGKKIVAQLFALQR
jgi:glutamate 5-kinase